MTLKGKKALVTGAQQGIGAAIAAALAEAGADVAINWLDDQAAAEKVAADVARHGRKAALLKADVLDLDQAMALPAAARDALGGLDILVNNAAVFPRAHFLELTPETWDFTLGVNLRGMAFVSQAAGRIMRAAGRGGSIVSIASGAVQGWERSGHYAASKGGMVSLVRSMAYDLAADRIRCNAVAPGITDTAQPRGGYSEAELAALVQGLPVPRMGRVDEIASVVVFLASDASSYMTGQTLHVNGGAFMS